MNVTTKVRTLWCGARTLSSVSVIFALLVVLVPLQAAYAATPIWLPTASMFDGRWAATETLLPDGKVLIAGGTLGGDELYDPDTGQFTSTGSMTSRYGARATLLPNGMVLVTGGMFPNFDDIGDWDWAVSASAELYDPVTGGWTPTGSMTVARTNHSATLLPNGKVLVAAGANLAGKWASSELYDPATGLWTTTGSMARAREGGKAVLLPNGKVLVTGGWDAVSQIATAELYNPGTGLWAGTDSMSRARAAHTATLLKNGKVLVTGGSGTSAELYDPATGHWTATGSMADARGEHAAVMLPNGKVLVMGGYGSGIAKAEMYDPVTGLWSSAGSMVATRTLHTATLLNNGKVLVAAGWTGTSILNSAELYSEGAIFISQRAYDGWVLESAENSNKGGSLNSSATTLRVGDNAAKKQYRSIFSFNTGPRLPDDAVITRVMLKVKVQGVIGGPADPVSAFQGFMADIKYGPFGVPALQTTDFQATPSDTVGPSYPELFDGCYYVDLTDAKNYVNQLSAVSGLTQVRLRFKRDDNNNKVADYLSLFSGNDTTGARPQLIVEYGVP